MTPERYFRWSIWSPLFVPLVVVGVTAAANKAGLGPQNLGPLVGFLAMSFLVGGVPYLVFAGVGAWLYRRASAQRLRAASLYAPLAFGLFVFIVAAVWSFPDLGQYGLSQPFFLGLVYAMWSIGVGYVYVLLVHVTFGALTRMGLIACHQKGPTSDAFSSSAPPNKRMKLTIALASPHGTRRRGSACSPFGEHRAIAAYPRCWAAEEGQRNVTVELAAGVAGSWHLRCGGSNERRS